MNIGDAAGQTIGHVHLIVDTELRKTQLDGQGMYLETSTPSSREARMEFSGMDAIGGPGYSWSPSWNNIMQ